MTRPGARFASGLCLGSVRDSIDAAVPGNADPAAAERDLDHLIPGATQGLKDFARDSDRWRKAHGCASVGLDGHVIGVPGSAASTSMGVLPDVGDGRRDLGGRLLVGIAIDVRDGLDAEYGKRRE